MRQNIRDIRRQIPVEQQSQHAHALASAFTGSPLFQHQHFACYWAVDGEISLKPLIDLLLSANKTVYLPVLKRQSQALNFAHYHPKVDTTPNRFGILEPQESQYTPLEALDVICLPLVGFDTQGHRLGMGGGFYDRTLSSVRDNPTPIRVGIAHNCQQQGQIQAQEWDIPLHKILTESGFIEPQP
ncbi:MAG: 5-formyltetrahydrofolate cyclo-ligase [Methylococcales bacterium]|nr:5-formyltetrahydrofolate cyclo-ligase [Methylococcales bacterium]MBT7442553.1 5-formyltetrahydrofolate cyclo-ligase [Methylococcales bacterium]